MKIINTLYGWYGKRNVYIVLGILVVLVVSALTANKGAEEEEANDNTPLVTVGTALELSGSQSLQLIGTVRSVDEASIDSEVASRVTAVPATLGGSVQAGNIIVRLENASEYASLLQAEGAYEAALAAGAQSDSSLQSAETALNGVKNNAVSSVQQAYTTTSGVVYSNLDVFYRNPQTVSPSLQISTNGQGDYLRSERIALQDALEVWQQSSIALTNNSNLELAIASAESTTRRVISLLDIFIELTSDSSIAKDQINGVQVGTYTSSLVSARANLNSTLSSLQSAETSLQNANESVAQAQIASTQGTDYSAANAQIKQALGSLRAAQANYEKTLLRTPISGVVQELNVQTGDFVSNFETVAKVVGAGGLEITTYVGDKDREAITVGQEVLIEGNTTGTITHIAPAVDSVTKKTEVRIGTDSEGIKSGDTVRISITATETSSEVILPLTAVKLAAEDASIFTVEGGILVAKRVALGTIRGGYVVITEGLSNTDTIVSDVRGLIAGQAVTTQ